MTHNYDYVISQSPKLALDLKCFFDDTCKISCCLFGSFYVHTELTQISIFRRLPLLLLISLFNMLFHWRIIGDSHKETIFCN